MFGRTALVAGALALCAAAESFKPTKIHNVTVSKDKGKFTPNNTIADVGDIIQFQFYPTNHSVVRAAYGNPCVPIETIDKSQTGFYSGHFVITDPNAPPPTWNLTVNDTNPIYYYCTAVDSCIGEGMVGAINAPDLTHVQTQFDDAREAKYMLEPGQTPPDATSTSSSSSSSTPSPTSSPTSTPSAAPSHSGLPGGAIAGIVIGALVIVALLVVVFWLLGRHRGLISATQAGSSNAGGFRADRTEQWAASSAFGGQNSDMTYAQHTRTPFSEPSGYANSHAAPAYSQPMQGQSWSTAHAAGSPAAQPVMSPTMDFRHQEVGPMELSAEGVTELEAPHVLKQ